MAETTDVETDAAPSVGVVNLSSLDIGSECTVHTDLEGSKNCNGGISAHNEEKEGETSKETRRCNQVQAVEEVVDCDPEVVDSDPEVVDRDPEGVHCDEQLPDPDIGSLNLAETYSHDETLKVDEGIVNTLLDRDSDGDTLLHVAIILDNISLALLLTKLMVELIVPLDVSNRLQQTALHLAVLMTRSDLVKNLLRAGASPFVRDLQLRTPAFLACERNDMPMLKVIMQNVNWHMRDDEATSKLLNVRTHCLDLPNADGERCLHVAVKHDNIEMARALIENGADPNLPDRRSGRTPLHVAANLGRVEITKFLITVENIDVDQRTYNGESAIEIAHMHGQPEVLALLQPLSFPMMKRR